MCITRVALGIAIPITAVAITPKDDLPLFASRKMLTEKNDTESKNKNTLIAR